MRKLCLAILLLTFSVCFVSCIYFAPTTTTQYSICKNGQSVVYRGVNVSNYSKSSDTPWCTQSNFVKLLDWNFNLVRYLVFWSRIEPIEGTYDTLYIRKTKQRILQLDSLGIDVLLDVHQDVYSAKFGGDGFPGWTVFDNGASFVAQANWSLDYFEPAVINCYNYFWNSSELQNRYVKMLKYLLTNFDTLIVGIDVMNEPFGGTTLNFEQVVLTNFYDSIQQMMTTNNFRTAMVFEPEMYTSGGLATTLKFVPRRNCIYAPHFYDPLIHEGQMYTKVNTLLMKNSFNVKLTEANNFKVPLLFGEFGVSPSVGNYLQYVKDFVSLCANSRVSWCYWSYDLQKYDAFGIVSDSGTSTSVIQILQSK